MDSAKDAFDLETESQTTKKRKGDDSQYEEAEDDYLRVTPGPGDKLGEDELTLVFSNTWLSAQDLLNFRLVSRTWRDAATTTLRRRDACVVKLWADTNLDPPYFYKYDAKYTDENKLSQLTELISNSPKFPATDFCIHIPYLACIAYTKFPDLFYFFKLHGDKIKTLRLRPCGWISHKFLLDILQIFAPTLDGLDLSEVYIKESDGEDGSEENALKWTSKAVPLKSITLGRFGYYCKLLDTSNGDSESRSNTHNNSACLCMSFVDRSHELEFLRLLLSSPLKLSCIENVTLNTLQTVLTKGKGHLIRSFNYLLWDAHWVPASLLSKFISLNPKPKLSKVILDLQSDYRATAPLLTSLNEFIESFKDTVQKLELFCFYYQRAWDPLLNIPPMKNLKSFTLVLKIGCGVFGDDHSFSDCQVCQAEEFKTVIDVRGTVFQFEDKIPVRNYFPSLMKVHLHSRLSKFNEISPMSFFSFRSNTDDGSAAQSGFFPKVDILEINRMDVGSRPRLEGTCQSSTEASLVAEVFPNIRIFKFKCGEVSNLSSDLWTLCPNVEFMEIYDIRSYSWGRRDVEMSHFVDKVFTGFSDGILENLRKSPSGHQCAADELDDFNFEPERPSISGLRRLRELKLKFVGEWSTEFASSLTGIHAFSKLENTKFIISYDPRVTTGVEAEKVPARRNKIDDNIDAADDIEESRNEKIAKYEELIFGPLKPYVHIIHARRKHERWDWDD